MANLLLNKAKQLSNAYNFKSVKKSKIGLYAISWAICIVLLSFQFIESLSTVLSKREFIDNGLIALSLVILLVAVYKYKIESSKLECDRSWSGLCLLIISSLVTSFGIFFHFARISWIGFILMSASFLWALTGYKNFVYWRPVILFSTTLIPIGTDGIFSYLSVFLKNLSLSISTTLSSLFIDLKVNDFVISIDRQPVEITSACSGLSILTSLFFLVLLWQLIKPIKMLDLGLLLALSCFVGVITNSLRLFITFLAIHFYSLDFGLAIHSNIEIFLLPIAMLFLWSFANRMVKA